MRVIQRLDSEAIAREKHLRRIAAAIPDGEGEHAVETTHALRAPLFVGMHDDFGVGTRTESVTQACQGFVQFAKIVNLAVEDYSDASGFVPHRLRSAGEVNDG